MHKAFLALVFFHVAVFGTYGQSLAAGDALAWELPAITDRAVQDRADRLYLGTQRLAHYLIGELRPWADDPSLLLLTTSKSGEHSIRPNAGTAAGLAFLYRFGPYDKAVVGISRAELLQDKLVPIMRYLTTTHVTGSRPTSDGKNWGDAWQSAHWADKLGMAAWWAGRDLPADLTADVCRVIEHEAARFVDAQPPHQLRNDTKAEENAWNAQVFSAAIVLMPDHPRRKEWEAAFQKWTLSAWLRAADEHSSALVDGRPVSAQFTGVNIHDDFTLENHHIVHPDYMTAFSLSLGCEMEFVMTGRRPPQSLRHNVAGIYENLKWFSMPDGGFVYPSGQDWALFRQVDWLYPNLLFAVFERDPEAWGLLDVSFEVLERMQARSPEGAIYLPGENFFASAQTDKIYHFARGWLSLHFAKATESKSPRLRGVRRLDEARIILNRTPSAVHAFCWGKPIMAQCMPMQKDRLISPHDRSGIGHILLAGQDKPLAVSLVEAQVDNDEQSFSVNLVVDHGKDELRAHLQFRSQADGSWTMQEKLVALRDVTTAEIATGLIGVLNNPQWIYERGERLVTLGERQSTVPSGSGGILNADGVRDVSVDSVLQIRSPRPLSVRYKAAARSHRSRITDELSLNIIEGEQNWKAGQTISEWEATVRCEPRDHQ
jgi:hypothetical protein